MASSYLVALDIRILILGILILAILIAVILLKSKSKQQKEIKNEKQEKLVLKIKSNLEDKSRNQKSLDIPKIDIIEKIKENSRGDKQNETEKTERKLKIEDIFKESKIAAEKLPKIKEKITKKESPFEKNIGSLDSLDRIKQKIEHKKNKAMEL